MRRARGAVVAASAAVVLLGVGAATFATAPTPASFGWFAYTPLSDGSFSGGVVWNSQRAVGAAMVVASLLVAGTTAGYVVGRRRSPPR